MSKENITTKSSYNHLSAIERGKIEVLHKQGKSQSNIARELGRNPSTISRELKRGTATQMKKKVHIDSVESFIKRYEKFCEDEVILSTKTLYNYIHQGLLEITRIDLPHATRMKPRTKKRPSTHKRLAGNSIDKRPKIIQDRTGIERKNAPKIWRDPPVYLFILNQNTL